MTILLTLGEYLRSAITFKLLILAVGADTTFGCIRAVRCRSLNSSVGIDGAIRKVSMLLSAVFMALLDLVVDIDLTSFVPDDVRTALELNRAGALTVICLLFVAYEAVSVLKNMVLCGLPVRGVLKTVYDFMLKNTDELPDMDGIEGNEDEKNP